MVNYNIGDSFQRLLGEMYYKYRGYRAENLSNGNVLVVLKEMTKEEFHLWVDNLYQELDRSINKLKK